MLRYYKTIDFRTIVSKVGVALISATLFACQTSILDKTQSVTRIVAIGDSITQGITKPEHQGHRNSVEGGWVTRLESRLSSEFGEGQFEVFNEGKSADTSYAINKRLSSSLFEYEPDIVILGAGTNDINSNWMIWPGKLYVGRSANNAQSFEAIMRLTCEKIKTRLPEAEVMVVGLTSPNRSYWSESSWGFTIKYPEQAVVDQLFQEYNSILAMLSIEFGFQFVDFSKRWPAELEARWNLSADGIHPNDDGYQLMTDMVYQKLLQLPRG